jgi:6-phosphogluconolactonase
MRIALLVAFLAGCGGSLSGGADGAPAGPDAGGDVPDAGGAPDAFVPTGPVMVYVGGGDAKIHVFEMDPETLALTPRGTTATGAGPSFLAFDPSRAWLAAVNEGADAIQTFAIDPQTGALTPVDTTSARGQGPAHVAVHPTSGHLMWANYGDGTASIVAASAAGMVQDATADDLVPGANAHQIVAHPARGVIYVPCKGTDRVATYAFDPGTGVATALSSGVSPAGAGPRHIAIAPDGDVAWVVNELSSTVTTFTVAADGTLAPIDQISTLPGGFAGPNTGAEIEVHPSGRFVYASNRGHDSIAVFEVLGDGTLAALGHTPTGGQRPRHFSLALGGAVLLVANQTSGNIHAFRVNDATGALTPVGLLAKVPGPAFVGAVSLPGT